MVYLVVTGCYSDWSIVGYSNNKDDAEKFCANHNYKMKDENSEYYYDDDYYIIECNKIKTNDKIKNIKLLYEHEIVFDFYKWGNYKKIKTENGMRDEPDRYECYVGEKRKTKFICNKNMWFAVKVTTDSRGKAEKIAQDYYAQFKYNRDTFGLDTAIKIMNIEMR